MTLPQVPRCPERGCNGSARRLGSCAAVALLAWTVLFIVLAMAISVAETSIGSTEEEDVPTVATNPSALLRTSTIGLSVLGSLTYIFVGWRAPRPAQLHMHGATLMLMLPELVVLSLAHYLYQHRGDLEMVSHLSAAAFVGMWSTRRVLFFELMTQKMAAIGPASKGRRYLDCRPWGRVLTACTLIGGIVPFSLSSTLVPERAAGASTLDGNEAPRVKVIFYVSGIAGLVGAIGIYIAGLALILVAWRLTRIVLAKMVQRHVTPDLLAKVRGTLRCHLVGVIVSVICNNFLITVSVVDGLSFHDAESTSVAMVTSVAHSIDVVGGIAGVFLLSGIGRALLREDPETDINCHIRSTLHSAVLTSRAETVFEGHLVATARTPGNNRCIASFPGKFLPEWHTMTWLCEQDEMSCACVFLPTSDPQQRFGKHMQCPDTPGQCWCHSLYGEVKQWGCSWFDAWKANIEKAVSLGLDLVVVFYPGQVGKGQVDWQDLGSVDLWDGVGLGGSQKAEVAYLRKCGYEFIAEDLRATRVRMNLAQEPIIV